jgi:hypothetical protein
MMTTGAQSLEPTKRVSAISASEAMNSTAPAAASTLPEATAHVTIAAITAMYATERTKELLVTAGARRPEKPCAEKTCNRDHRDRRDEERAGRAPVPGEADHIRDVGEEKRGQPGDEPIGGEHQEDIAGE